MSKNHHLSLTKLNHLLLEKFYQYLFPLIVIIKREDEFCDRLSKNADFSGFTPLHYAAISDDYECIKLLLDFGKILFTTTI